MFPALGSLSEKIYRRASEVMPGGSTRRALYDMRAYVRSGSGCRITDIEGNSLLDASNNFMVLIHGHAHAPTIDAMRSQLDRGISFGMSAPEEVQLAEHLCDRVASIERVVFCNTGSEAVMHSIKAARAFTQRPKIVKCEGLYHGAYDYAEVSNAPPVRQGSRGYPKSVAYGPYTSPNVLEDVIVVPFNDAQVTEAIIRAQADQIAAVIIDPVPSRIGYALANEGYLTMLRSTCDELGILLIFDEVASFRVAHGGAQSLSNIRPDFTLLGKVIGGGMPVGAIGGSDHAMRIFDPSGKNPAVSFTGTFNGHPMSMVAGLATVVDYDADAVARLNALGDYVRSKLRSDLEKKGLPVHVTGCSSFMSIFFGPRSGSDYHAVAHRPEELPILARFWSAAMDRKLLIDTSGRFNLSTAFKTADAEELVEIVVASIEEAFDAVPGPQRTSTPN